MELIVWYRLLRAWFSSHLYVLLDGVIFDINYDRALGKTNPAMQAVLSGSELIICWFLNLHFQTLLG